MKSTSFLIALALSSVACHPALLRHVQVENRQNQPLFVAIVGSTDRVVYLNEQEVAKRLESYCYVPIVLSCEFNLVDDRRAWGQNYPNVSFEYYMKHRNCALSDLDWEIVNDLAVTSTPEFRIYSANGKQLLGAMPASGEDDIVAQLVQFLITVARRSEDRG